MNHEVYSITDLWLITEPFGTPVEPLVNNTYAASVSITLFFTSFNNFSLVLYFNSSIFNIGKSYWSYFTLSIFLLSVIINLGSNVLTIESILFLGDVTSTTV